MLVNILGQLGIVAFLIASLTQQVEVLQLEVEELIRQEEVIEEVIKEETIAPVQEYKTGWYELGEIFRCIEDEKAEDKRICDCQFKEFRIYDGEFRIGMVDVRKNHCSACDNFKKREEHIQYDPDTKSYVNAIEGECYQNECPVCEDLDYWIATDVDCDWWENGCIKKWNEREWQVHNYYECWMKKCVYRGIDKYRYLDKNDHWIEVEVPEFQKF